MSVLGFGLPWPPAVQPRMGIVITGMCPKTYVFARYGLVGNGVSGLDRSLPRTEVGRD
jgi:hypothetical protein